MAHRCARDPGGVLAPRSFLGGRASRGVPPRLWSTDKNTQRLTSSSFVPCCKPSRKQSHRYSRSFLSPRDKMCLTSVQEERDWYVIAEQSAPAPHLAHPKRCADLRNVVVTVPCVSRSCEHFSDGFDLHLLLSRRMRRSCATSPSPCSSSSRAAGTFRTSALPTTTTGCVLVQRGSVSDKLSCHKL